MSDPIVPPSSGANPSDNQPQYGQPQYGQANNYPSAGGNYAPPATGYQAPGYNPYYQPAPPTNTMAIISLVSSFFVSLVAVITGHIALKQIQERGEGGKGFAIAGLIIGYIGLIGTIIAIVILIFVLFLAVPYGLNS